MKMTLKISILLNLVLLGGMVYLLKDQRRENIHFVPASPKHKPTVQAAARPAPATTPGKEPEPFRWSQLESSKNYWDYIANLRAIGCPEATIEDIVRGDAERAFSWERKQLGLNGSGTGPWSRAQERQLVASLLTGQRTPPAESTVVAQNGTESREESNAIDEPGGTPAFSSSAANQAHNNAAGEVAQTSGPTESAVRTAPSYPLFLQNVNWSGLGFTPSQQAAIAQVRQQYLNQLAHPNLSSQNTADPSSDSPNQTSNPTGPNNSPANSNPENQLKALLGSQGWAAYQQLQYWYWYQPQVVAANAEGKPLCLDLNAFSPK